MEALLDHNRGEAEMDSRFDIEFVENREIIEVLGGEVLVVDINPDARGPVVLLAPGFLAGNEAQKEVMRHMSADGGRRVVSLEHARHGGKDLEGEFHDVLEHPAASLLAILDHKELDDVHIAAHSAGFIHSMIAASKDDMQRIRSITGIGPAGLTGIRLRDQAKAFNMVFQGARDMRRQPNRREVAAETARYLSGNVDRTRVEGREIKNAQVINLLEKVAEQMPVTILMQQADELFRPGGYMRALQATGWPERGIGDLSIATVIGKNVTHSGYLSRKHVMIAVEQVIEENIRKQFGN